MIPSAQIAAFLVVLASFPSLAAAKEPLPTVAVKLLADGLTAPISLVTPPDNSGRRFVSDQQGTVHVIAVDGARLPTPLLDLRDRLVRLLPAVDERGLWSLAFHPEFTTNGRFFVTYSGKRRAGSPFTGNTAYTWRLSEFRVSSDDSNRADATSERVILELDWVNRKHNDGGLAFGPDGMLYVGIGDGGGVHGVPDVYIPPKLDHNDLKKAAEIKEDPYRLPARFHKYDRYAQDLTRL
jgi:glucose/arabinose dehydrogenase